MGNKINLQLAFDDQRAGAHHLGWAAVGVLDDENKVGAILVGQPLVALLEFLLRDVSHRRQHPQAVQEARLVVALSEWPQFVTLGQFSLDFWREQLGREKI